MISYNGKFYYKEKDNNRKDANREYTEQDYHWLYRGNKIQFALITHALKCPCTFLNTFEPLFSWRCTFFFKLVLVSFDEPQWSLLIPNDHFWAPMSRFKPRWVLLNLSSFFNLYTNGSFLLKPNEPIEPQRTHLRPLCYLSKFALIFTNLS